MKTIIQSFKIIALALILSLGVSYVSAWTAPTVAPPGGNTASPLNTSANTQYKAGLLGVESFRSYGNLIVDGNVGIGTASPTAKLDVTSTSGFGIRYIKTGSKDARISVGDPTRTWSIASGWATAGDFSIVEEGVAGDRLYIKQNGNVGFGTTNPANKLDIATVPLGNGTGISLNGKVALSATTADTWLRLNNNNGNTSDFTSGVYTPGRMTADGGFSTTWTVSPPAGGTYIGGTTKLGSSLKFSESGSVGDATCSSLSDAGRLVYLKEGPACTWRGCILGGFSKKFKSYLSFCQQTGQNSVGWNYFGNTEWYEGAYGDSSCTSGPVYC